MNNKIKNLKIDQKIKKKRIIGPVTLLTRQAPIGKIRPGMLRFGEIERAILCSCGNNITPVHIP
jgi:DNA-directed RNA polymerase beta subunit